jgi:hypothetical protein
VASTRAVCDLDRDTAESLARMTPAGHFARIVDSFAADLTRLAHDIEVGQRSGDQAAIRRAAHGLAGAASSVGAARLAELARQGMGQAACPPDFADALREAGQAALRALRALQAPSRTG